MKEKLMRFMTGRYGLDSLGKATIATALAAVVLASLFDAEILSVLAWVLILCAYFRMFSRNLYKRSAENQIYLAKTRRIRTWFSTQKNLMAQRKTHHIYTCPSCRQKIRVPRGKGRIEIRCPKCHTHFIKKS